MKAELTLYYEDNKKKPYHLHINSAAWPMATFRGHVPGNLVKLNENVMEMSKDGCHVIVDFIVTAK